LHLLPKSESRRIVVESFPSSSTTIDPRTKQDETRHKEKRTRVRTRDRDTDPHSRKQRRKRRRKEYEENRTLLSNRESTIQHRHERITKSTRRIYGKDVTVLD
jgi:hypothetical protein